MITEVQSNAPKGSLLLAALLGGLFFAICFHVMQIGHLHEDAYILFQYSRSLASGLGISFDVANGPAEGATDFFWMAALGLAHKILKGYVPIGVISAGLNSLGIAYIASRIIGIRRCIDLNGCALCLLLLLSGGASASVGGFATIAYGAVYLATILAFWNNRLVRGLVLAALLALFRPDGFFLGAATIIAFLILQRNQLDPWRTFGKVIAFYVVPLALYFVWRFSYFGLLLPLPLLVKQRTDFLFEGLRPNLASLRNYIAIIAGIVVFRRHLDRRLAVLGLSGSLTLYTLLLFAHQSQNIGARFQFPLHVVIILLAASSFPSKNRIAYYSSVLIFVAAILSFRGFSANIKHLISSDYINSFPQIISQRVSADSIAITEAGRFPYWYNSTNMIDLVGLNSKRVVLNGPLAELQRVAPDLVFVHHAGRFVFPQHMKNEGADFFAFDPRSVRLNQYEGSNPVALAPAAALKDAINRSLVGIAVKYDDHDLDYIHVYFLSKSVDLNEFKKALADSFSTKTSYLSSEGELSRARAGSN